MDILAKIKKTASRIWYCALSDILYLKFRRFTMVPRSVFKSNLVLCSKFRSVNGAIVECGVWRGGMIAAMSKIFGRGRKYFLFDSFEGLPKADKEKDGKTAIEWQDFWQKDAKSPFFIDNCRAEMAYAEKAMKMSGAKYYVLAKGWFSDTLPKWNAVEKIAVLRLDGDWYESTMECLERLYPFVTDEGLIVIDDYYAWDGCTKAVHDFLSKNELPHRIRQFEGRVCYIVKEKNNKFERQFAREQNGLKQ